jgi:sugar transferase (PEP-CTERM system associated)
MSWMVARRISRRSLALVTGEACLIAGAVVLSAWLLLGDAAKTVLTADGGGLKAAIVAMVSVLCLYYADFYNLRGVADAREMLARLLRGLAAASFLFALLYYWFPSLAIAPGVYLVTTLVMILVIAVWRVAFDRLGRHLRPHERLLLVGTSRAAVSLAREMYDRRHELGVEIVGFIDPDLENVGNPVINPGVIGTIEDIPSIARARAVDRIVVSLDDARGKLPMYKLLEMKLEGVSFDHLASLYEEYTGKIAVENLRPSWLIFSSGFRNRQWRRILKRGFDILAAIAMLVTLFPLMALIAIANGLASGGRVLHLQQRVGKHGRVFTAYKFRSIQESAETSTVVGRFLRRTRLDDLPQLWNVLVGDMSVTGPRPERPEFVQQLTQEIPFYGQRHVVRPGLTGWAQVRYTYGASVEDALQKLQYDLFYIKNMSMTFDLFIILSSIKTVLLTKGA